MSSYRAMPGTQNLSRMEMNEPRSTRTLLTRSLVAIPFPPFCPSRHGTAAFAARASTVLHLLGTYFTVI